MNEFNTIPIARAENAKAEGKNDSPQSMGISSGTGRLFELEIENARLQRLVAELLLKNQQLRKPD
jgi:hypothetical protein